VTDTEDRTLAAEPTSRRRGEVSDDRRHSRVAIVVPERRTGFDRRIKHYVTGHLRDNPSQLMIVLILINVLSLIDFAFTWVQLQGGVSVEGNPFLAPLFAQNPLVAWSFKTCLVLAVSYGIWTSRRYRPIIIVALMAFVLYGGLFIYHIVGMRATGLI